MMVHLFGMALGPCAPSYFHVCLAPVSAPAPQAFLSVALSAASSALGIQGDNKVTAGLAVQMQANNKQ